MGWARGGPERAEDDGRERDGDDGRQGIEAGMETEHGDWRGLRMTEAGYGGRER